MTTDNKKISEAVEGALAYIKTNAPEEHSKLIADGKLKDAITTAAREAADEEVKLAHEFASQPEQDIRKRLETPRKQLRSLQHSSKRYRSLSVRGKRREAVQLTRLKPFSSSSKKPTQLDCCGPSSRVCAER